MRRLKRLLRIVLIGAAVVVPPLLLAVWLSFWAIAGWIMERQSASAEISVSHVGGSVYTIDATLRGRQIGATLAASIGADGVLLVDTMMTESLAQGVRSALDELGAGEVVRVVNTHPHPDHARGNQFLTAGTAIVAHRRTAERLGQKVKPFRWLPAVPPLPRHSLPSESVEHSSVFELNGERVHLLHWGPGHTDGDLVVYFESSRVAHVGDLFHGYGGHTSIDGENSGGEAAGLLRTLGALVERLPEDVAIIGGHGGVGQVWKHRDLALYLEMLAEVSTHVAEQIASGASSDDVVEGGVPSRWHGWFEAARGDSVMHGHADGWLANLHRNLSAGDE